MNQQISQIIEICYIVKFQLLCFPCNRMMNQELGENVIKINFTIDNDQKLIINFQSIIWVNKITTLEYVLHIWFRFMGEIRKDYFRQVHKEILSFLIWLELLTAWLVLFQEKLIVCLNFFSQLSNLMGLNGNLLALLGFPAIQADWHWHSSK